MSDTRVYAIFDVDHDRDLYERLIAGSGTAGLGIAVSGGSERFAWTDHWRERALRAIRAADRVVVICGAHTEAAVGVTSELRIAQEEQKPYLLLWGRRELMCTKPTGAKASEGMYTWTSSTLEQQFAMMRRVEEREAAASGMKRATRPQADPHAPAS